MRQSESKARSKLLSALHSSKGFDEKNDEEYNEFEDQ